MKRTKQKEKNKSDIECKLPCQTHNDECYELQYKIGAHVVAGRPASGKTSIAIGLINDCIRDEYPIAYVSLDMEKKSFFERLSKAVPPSYISKAIKSKRFLYSEEKEVTKLLPYLQSLRENGTKAVIIDFIQLLKVNGKALDTDSLVAILSAFALKNQMSIVLLCQWANFSKDVYPFAQTIHILRKETKK